MKKSESRKGLTCLLAVAAVVVIAVIVYFTSFHNADVLKIENGRVKGLKPTWIVGTTVENGKETYVKIGDVSAPKDYKSVSGTEDTDGDPITTNFVFVGKKPEQNPGTVAVEPWPWREGAPEYSGERLLNTGKEDPTLKDGSEGEKYCFNGTVSEVIAED